MCPKALCDSCKKEIFQTTDGALKAEELMHHINSVDLDALVAGKLNPKHFCNLFTIYDDNETEVRSDFFAHGRFRYSMDVSEYTPGLAPRRD